MLPSGALGLSVGLAAADAAATTRCRAGRQERFGCRASGGRFAPTSRAPSNSIASDGEPFVAVDPEQILAWWGNGGWRNGGWRKLGQWLAQWRLGQRRLGQLAQRLAQLVTMTATPEIGMVVVQPTAFCNIACTYCYLPDRSNKHVIAQSTVTRLFEQIFASGWSCPEITVIWHAGEPLVVPVSFYREAFATIERMRPASVHVKHSFQTNGTLIDAEWCDLFKEWHVGVGVSLDGPRELHDLHRKSRSGKGTFDKTIAGIRSLRENNVEFHVISVLSHTSLDQPEELLDFYLSEGIDQICFNVEESEGDHVSSLFHGPELRKRYAAFLRSFWHLARQSGRVRFVREIDLALPRMFRPEGVPTRNIQTEPLAMLNVDSHGNVSSFSPELLGLKNKDYGDYLLGNINFQSLARDPRHLPGVAALSRHHRGRAGLQRNPATTSRCAAAGRRSTSCSRTAASPAPKPRTAR